MERKSQEKCHGNKVTGGKVMEIKSQEKCHGNKVTGGKLWK